MLDERPTDAAGRLNGTPGENGDRPHEALQAMVARLDDLERRLAEIEAAHAARLPPRDRPA